MTIPSEVATRPVGHTHFWERAAEHGVTRRTFLGRSAGAVGAVAGLGLVGAAPAFAAVSDPKPIPGGVQPGGPGTPVFHLFLPGAGNEPSTITDFNGFVGITEIAGTGEDGDGAPLDFDVDLRFMKGLYAGEDGKLRHGAFAFV
jgi:hypothetical protein